MIETYKIVTNKCGSYLSPILQFSNRTNTRGNWYKLANQSFHYDARKYSFTPLVVNIWNSLPNHVVDVSSVAVFKSPLDKFWDLQPVKLDYKACLTGTGNRSEYVLETE